MFVFVQCYILVTVLKQSTIKTWKWIKQPRTVQEEPNNWIKLWSSCIQTKVWMREVNSLNGFTASAGCFKPCGVNLYLSNGKMLIVYIARFRWYQNISIKLSLFSLPISNFRIISENSFEDSRHKRASFIDLYSSIHGIHGCELLRLFCFIVQPNNVAQFKGNEAYKRKTWRQVPYYIRSFFSLFFFIIFILYGRVFLIWCMHIFLSFEFPTICVN